MTTAVMPKVKFQSTSPQTMNDVMMGFHWLKYKIRETFNSPEQLLYICTHGDTVIATTHLNLNTLAKPLQSLKKTVNQSWLRD